MVIITLTCTITLYSGMDGMTEFTCPYDMELELDEGKMTAEKLWPKLNELSAKYGLTVERADVYDSISLSCSLEDGCFGIKKEDERQNCGVILMTLAAYEELSGEQEPLLESEALTLWSKKNYRCYILIRRRKRTGKGDILLSCATARKETGMSEPGLRKTA